MSNERGTVKCRVRDWIVPFKSGLGSGFHHFDPEPKTIKARSYNLISTLEKS